VGPDQEAIGRSFGNTTPSPGPRSSWAAERREPCSGEADEATFPGPGVVGLWVGERGVRGYQETRLTQPPIGNPLSSGPNLNPPANTIPERLAGSPALAAAEVGLCGDSNGFRKGWVEG
jgi:hypothetical protein